CLSDREERSRWQAAGGINATDRATKIVNEILNSPMQPAVPSDVRERIKTEIPGLRSFVMD
ncbi:MAG: trimethylamine methyltransferase family protein, partial [Deltaproteobacteria bacterium]|nr:trimethylamine methyltransferase family protein [Deltaproteobacteria bacterium]